MSISARSAVCDAACPKAFRKRSRLPPASELDTRQQLAARRAELRARLLDTRGRDGDIHIVGERMLHDLGKHRVAEALPPRCSRSHRCHSPHRATRPARRPPRPAAHLAADPHKRRALPARNQTSARLIGGPPSY